MSNAVLLRLPEVMKRCGFGRSSIYLMMDQGLWPKAVRIGLRAVAWPANEVDAINSARVAGKDADQIRSMVSKMNEARAKRIEQW